MHLGLTEPLSDKRLSALWLQHPGLGVCHAAPRRDRWARLADRLDLAARRRMPSDPGIRAWLAQLDVELLLVASDDAGPLETDYQAAAAGLQIPTATLQPDADAVLSQAAPGAIPAPPRPPATPPDLWARLVWSELTLPPEDDAGAPAQDGARGLGARLQETYARRIFPAIAGATGALAPERRPLLGGALKERLGRSAVDDETSAEGALASAAESSGVVVLGPWWGDADQELLYWTPFLSWWRRRYRIDKQRIVAVSSGQAGAWYEGVGGRYIDISELYDPDSLMALEQARRQELESRGKRFGGTDADSQVLKRLNRRLGFRGVTAVPPWAMAVMLDRFWSGQAGPALLAARTRPQPLKIKPKIARKLFPGLPESYVALGLGETGPDRGPALERLALRVAQDGAVVVLAEPEDHAFAETLAGRDGRIRVIGLEPRTGKAAASAVLAAARGFIGPQGWMAYAAAALGRPAVALTAAAGPRPPIDQAAAAQLLARPPVWIDIAETELAAVALEHLAAERAD